jgi:hypothetical protein
MDFFDNILSNIDIVFKGKGLIEHVVPYKDVLGRLKHIIFRTFFGKSTRRQKQMTLSKGYLSFILHGLSILYSQKQDYSFWRNERLKKIIKEAVLYINERKPYGCGEDGSKYTWGYNPVGIEMAFSLQAFGKYLSLETTEYDIKYWLGMQLENYFDFDASLMIKNTIDSNILAARLYEAVYLDNYSIKC